MNKIKNNMVQKYSAVNCFFDLVQYLKSDNETTSHVEGCGKDISLPFLFYAKHGKWYFKELDKGVVMFELERLPKLLASEPSADVFEQIVLCLWSAEKDISTELEEAKNTLDSWPASACHYSVTEPFHSRPSFWPLVRSLHFHFDDEKTYKEQFELLLSPAIEELWLINGSSLKDLPFPEGFVSLRYLSLHGCRSLVDISSLTNHQNLEEINFGECEQLSDVSVLSDLGGLKKLNFEHCHFLGDLSFLADLPNMEDITLDYIESMPDLGVLSELKALRSVSICGYKYISDVDFLEGLTELESLYLDDCESVEDIKVLEKLPKLSYLSIPPGGMLCPEEPIMSTREEVERELPYLTL